MALKQSRWGRIFQWIGAVSILILVILISNLLGSIGRDVRTKERVTPVLANAVYRLAMENRLDHLQEDRLGSTEVAESLRETATSHGPIRRWEVVGAHPTPIGLPVFVVLEVQRNTKNYEVLTSQKGHFFISHSITDQAGLRKLGLPYPP